MLARGLRATAGLGGLGVALLLGRTWKDHEVRARNLVKSRTIPFPLPALSAEETTGGRSKQCASYGCPADMCCDTDVLEDEEGDVDFELGLVGSPNDQGRQQAQVEKLKAAVGKARDLCWVKMYESGAPGMTVAISVNGK